MTSQDGEWIPINNAVCTQFHEVQTHSCQGCVIVQGPVTRIQFISSLQDMCFSFPTKLTVTCLFWMWMLSTFSFQFLQWLGKMTVCFLILLTRSYPSIPRCPTRFQENFHTDSFQMYDPACHDWSTQQAAKTAKFCLNLFQAGKV